MLTRSTRMLVKLGALAVVALGSACTPDVHVHIHNSGGESSSGAPAPTPMPETFTTGDMTATAASDPSTDPTNNPTDPTTDPTNNPTDPTTDPTTGDPTGNTDPSGDTGSTGDSTGESTDTGVGDANYPQPVDGMCGAGFRYNAVGGHEYCAPPCPPSSPCPDAATGDATAGCVFNPDSSNDACDPKDDMCEGREMCAGNTCRLPASHCGLACQTTCPDGMECSAMSACRYPIE